jgi:hypothetical protein
VVVAAAVVVYAAAGVGRVGLLVLAAGAAAVMFLAVGLALALPATVPPALVGLMATWTAAASAHGGEVRRGTAIAAAAIFVTAELAYWSLEQAVVPDEPELAARRLGGLAVRAATALAVGALTLGALSLHAGSGLVLEAVGVAAAVGLLTLVFALARAESPQR